MIHRHEGSGKNAHFGSIHGDQHVILSMRATGYESSESKVLRMRATPIRTGLPPHPLLVPHPEYSGWGAVALEASMVQRSRNHPSRYRGLYASAR